MSGRDPWVAKRYPFTIADGGAHDQPAVAAFLAGMDKEGLYERHFAHGAAPNHALLQRLLRADGHDRVVLLALSLDGSVLGHAEYVCDEGIAEFALMVLPAARGHGIGKAMLVALLERAAHCGIACLQGLMMASNPAAIRVAHATGMTLRPGDDRHTVVAQRQFAELPLTLDAAPRVEHAHQAARPITTAVSSMAAIAA